MKVKITDLMDLYEDKNCPLKPTAEQKPRAVTDRPRGGNTEEVYEVKQSKYPFGWKQALSLAAVLALLVLGGFGVRWLLRRGPAPLVPGGSGTDARITSTEQGDPSPIPLAGEEQKALSSFLSFFAMQQIQNYPEELSEDGALIHLAFLWRRNYDPESFTIREVRPVEGLTPEQAAPVEGLTPEQLNETLERLLGKTVTPPEDGADFDYSGQLGQPAGSTLFSAGCFWDNPTGKDASFFFALAEGALPLPEPGRETVRFNVYYVNYERWGTIDMAAMSALSTAEAEALEAEEKLLLTATGEAKLERTEDGYRLLSYQTEPAAEQNNVQAIDLSEINWQLTYLAEQGIEKLETDLDEEYELAQFVHNYLKRHSDPGSDQLLYQSDETGSYETVGLGWVNLILDNMFGKTLSPIEGTDYTVLRGENYAQHESYHDGFFWWPAADGETSTRFARCDWARQKDGQVETSFMVYEANPAYMEQQRSQDITLDPGVDLEDWIWNQLIRMDDAELQTHIAAGEIIPIRTGAAKLQQTEQGWRLLSYVTEPAALPTREDSAENPEPVPESELPTEAATQAPEVPTENPALGPEDPALKAELQALFSDPDSWYARALSSSYARPEDVNLYLLFYDGFSEDGLTEQELKALYGSSEEDAPSCPTDRLPVDKINEILTEYFGLTLDQTAKIGVESWGWLPETNCYYHARGDTNIAQRQIQAARRLADGTVLMTYNAGFWFDLTDGQYPALRTAALRPLEDGGYQILSNLPGAWITGADLGRAGALYGVNGSYQAETTDANGTQAVRELRFDLDGELHYRDGDPDSEYSYWAWGQWWLEDENTFCCGMCDTKEDGNRTGPWRLTRFACSFDSGELVLTQLSETGFGDDAPGTELRFAPTAE